MEGQDETERRTAKRGKREVKGEKQSKAHGQVKKKLTGQNNISDCRWGK